MLDTIRQIVKILEESNNMVNYEEKRERFRRLASQRTNNVLKSIQILGNCSNKSTYNYTSEEVNKIFTEIERKLRDTKQQFNVDKLKMEFKL